MGHGQQQFCKSSLGNWRIGQSLQAHLTASADQSSLETQPLLLEMEQMKITEVMHL